MNNEETNLEPKKETEAEHPDLVKQIGKTTYRVKVHFSKTRHETMSDKIKRMLRDEISQL